MAIPEAIKTNFNTLVKAVKREDIALLECLDRNTGESAYAICAINRIRQADREPEIEMVPFGLMFSRDPYEMLLPASDPEFDDGANTRKMKAGGKRRRQWRENRPQG
ncbi:MAG TPA: DUF6117 family protein [Blastocatellia bacterium]|nr:DUF6117 family protein [Blastocatellia bacterium]